MKRKTLMMTAALTLCLGATAALAEIDARALGERYLAEGYTRVEVTIGPDDVKIEAIKGATEVEVIYDRETGEILEQESGAADAEDRLETGLRVRERDRNAFYEEDSDDDGDDDRGRGLGGDDSDDEGDDDHDDDHGDDHGDDHDDGDDDHGGDHGGDNDRDGDDD